MRKLLLIGLCGIVMGLAAAPAMAGSSPSQNAYGGTGATQLSQVQSVSTTTTSGTLPFTGLNVAALAGIAVVLLGSGIALRMRARSDHS